jgi:hypothetical protein
MSIDRWECTATAPESAYVKLARANVVEEAMKISIAEHEIVSRILEKLRVRDVCANPSDVAIERLDSDEGGANWRARLVERISGQARRWFVYAYAEVRRDFDLLPVD